MKLYGNSISPFVRKVLVYAAEKGIELEVRPIAFGRPDAEFLEVSPFGKIPGFGNAPAGSKGEAGPYADQVFITGVENGHVVFNYKGKDPKALEGITVENARWMGNLAGRLSDKQLSDAFRAGGFTDGEVTLFVRALRARINELKNLK